MAEDVKYEDAPKMKRRRRRQLYISGFSIQRIVMLLALIEIVIGAAIGLSWMTVHL